MRYIVTSALPYANGLLHLGHAIGAYIPADIYARYRRMKGDRVIFICGTDEHGTPIAIQAEKEGIPPKKLVDKYHELIKETFRRLGISFDIFSRTTKSHHYELSQKFFLKLLENNYIYKKTVKRPYCEKCRRFLPDRYVIGICPYCKAKDQRGDQCEVCGKQLEPNELIEPKCIICGNKPVERETTHWFFKLSAFSAKLEEWLNKNKHWPENVRNFSLGWLREGLRDRSITRDLEWGVPVPLEEAKGKVLYVWFDAPIGYLSFLQELVGEEWEKVWNNSRVVHFMGKDNVPFHAIIWPAMLLGYGLKLPWYISANEYLMLEGRKMSTSRGWVVWLHEILEKFDADQVRFYLIRINPEQKDANFSWKEFQSVCNTELIGIIGNFIHRVLVLAYRSLGEVSIDKDEREDCRNVIGKAGELIESFKFKEALKEIINFATEGNRYLNEREPWNMSREDKMFKDVLSVCCTKVVAISILLAPFLPFSAQKLWELLGLEGKVHEQGWDFPNIEKVNIVGEPKPLFRKIDDMEISNELEKLSEK